MMVNLLDDMNFHRQTVAMVIKEFNIRMLKKSSKPRPLQDTFNDLLSNIQKPLGIHHIRTINLEYMQNDYNASAFLCLFFILN
jgi:hypothetical protein